MYCPRNTKCPRSHSSGSCSVTGIVAECSAKTGPAFDATDRCVVVGWRQSRADELTSDPLVVTLRRRHPIAGRLPAPGSSSSLRVQPKSCENRRRWRFRTARDQIKEIVTKAAAALGIGAAHLMATTVRRCSPEVRAFAACSRCACRASLVPDAGKAEKMSERFAMVARQVDRSIAHPKTLDRARADVEGLGDLPHGEPLTSVTDERPFEAARSPPVPAP